MPKMIGTRVAGADAPLNQFEFNAVFRAPPGDHASQGARTCLPMDPDFPLTCTLAAAHKSDPHCCNTHRYHGCRAKQRTLRASTFDLLLAATHPFLASAGQLQHSRTPRLTPPSTQPSQHVAW